MVRRAIICSSGQSQLAWLAALGRGLLFLYMVHSTAVSNQSTMSEKLLHPRTFLEFMEALHVFTTLCTALGAVPPLVLASWLHHEVYKNLNGTVPAPWQFVYAMVLVNIGDIDNHSTLNFANIVQFSAIDYMRSRAKEDASAMFLGYESGEGTFQPVSEETPVQLRLYCVQRQVRPQHQQGLHCLEQR